MIGIFLDIESNGLNVFKHRCLEIAIKLISLENHNELGSYSSIVGQPESVWEKSDPNSLKVNGFTFEMLHEGKSESEVSSEIIRLFDKHQIDRKNAVYICQNPSFDRSFFAQLIDPELQEQKLWPYHWLDLASMFWALSLKGSLDSSPLPWEVGISKNKIASYLELDEEKTPHRAMQGVDHLIECYNALLETKR